MIGSTVQSFAGSVINTQLAGRLLTASFIDSPGRTRNGSRTGTFDSLDEPYDRRLSRTVLGGAGGEIPPVYSAYAEG